MERGERHAAVVGAGPAGLGAAWALNRSGWRVTVYEAREEVGGRLRTEWLAGAGADAAVQFLSDAYDTTVEMAGDLGIGELLVRAPGRDAVWRKGRAHTLRYGSVSSMVASGALPPGLKVTLGLRYLPFLERNGGSLDLNDPARGAEAGLDDESIAAWGERELGTDFVELLAYPLLAAYYGVTPEEVGAAVFHALAKAGLGVTVLGVRGGVGELARAAAEALTRRGVRFHTDAAVSALEPGRGGSGIDLVAADERAGHDAVVVAVPPGAAADLLPEVPALGSLRTRSTATLVLATDGPVSTGWFGLSIPRVEPAGRVLAAVCIQDEKGTGLTSAERGAVVVIPSPGEGAKWVQGEPREALDAALPVLDRLLPGVRDRVVEARLVRLTDGAFVPSPGHFGGVDELLDGLPSGVALAGDYLVAPTVEGAVRSGVRAAARLNPGAV